MKKLLVLFLFNNFLHTELFKNNSHIVQDDGSLTPGEENSYLKIIYDSIKLSYKKLITPSKKIWVTILINNCLYFTLALYLIILIPFYYYYNNNISIEASNDIILGYMYVLITSIILTTINTAYFIKCYIKDKPKRKKIKERIKFLKSRLNNIKNLPNDEKLKLESEVDEHFKGKINAYSPSPYDYLDGVTIYKNFYDVIEGIIESFIAYNLDKLIFTIYYDTFETYIIYLQRDEIATDIGLDTFKKNDENLKISLYYKYGEYLKECSDYSYIKNAIILLPYLPWI